MNGVQSWNGAPMALSYNERALMPSVPPGSSLLTATGTGTIAYAVGGAQPRELAVIDPALPTFAVVNGTGADLLVANETLDSAAPITVALAGPDVPGMPAPRRLSNDASLALAPNTSAYGLTSSATTITFSTASTASTVACIIGGPLDADGKNAYLIQLNAATGNTGPDGPPAAPGWYATTVGNTFTFAVPWAGHVLWIANLSNVGDPPMIVAMHGDEHAHAVSRSHERSHHHDVSHDALAAPTTWSGAPTNLSVNQNVSMTQTANGTMILVAQNYSPGNNAGTISYGSGGAKPTRLAVPALTNQPVVVIDNWGGSNLSVTNVSSVAQPIVIQAIGPGLPGIGKPSSLTPYGQTVKIGQYGFAQGTMSGAWMSLVMTANSGDTTVVAIVGGPPDVSGNNGYVVALNSPSGTTGVPSGSFGANPSPPAPPNYFATVSGNTYIFGPINWGSSVLFVANLSGSSAPLVSLTLQQN